MPTGRLQAAFLPVVQLFEGAGMLLEAVHGLRCTLLAGHGSIAGGAGDAAAAAALLPPPVQRAVMRGEGVAAALQRLSPVRLWYVAIPVGAPWN